MTTHVSPQRLHRFALPEPDFELSPVTGWTRAHWLAFADQQLLATRRHFTAGKALIRLPGRPSGSGELSDGLEGFARTFMLAAFRVAGEQGDDPFRHLAFYRGRHTYVGIDTLALSSIASAEVLRDLVPGFASGALKPFPIEPHAIYPLTRAAEAYAAVLGSSRDRVVFQPNG